MKIGKWLLLLALVGGSYYTGKNYTKIKEFVRKKLNTLIEKRVEYSTSYVPRVKTERKESTYRKRYEEPRTRRYRVETDIADSIDRRTEFEREKYRERKDLEREAAEAAIEAAKKAYERLRSLRNGGIFVETRPLYIEGKSYLENARRYYLVDNAESKRYAQLAQGKFIVAYGIASEIDSYWTRLEERLDLLDRLTSNVWQVVGDDHQTKLIEDAMDLYREAKRILSLPYGGTMSREVINKAYEKVEAGLKKIELAREIAKKKLGSASPQEQFWGR